MRVRRLGRIEDVLTASLRRPLEYATEYVQKRYDISQKVTFKFAFTVPPNWTESMKQAMTTAFRNALESLNLAEVSTVALVTSETEAAVVALEAEGNVCQTN